MINLLRGEFYKLRKSKCFYVCCIVAVAFVFLNYGMFALADHILHTETTEEETGMAEGDASVHVYYEGKTGLGEEKSVWDTMGIVDIAATAVSFCSMIIVGVFVAIFVYGEYANGAIKNSVCSGLGRWKIFLAKLVASNVGVIIIQVVMVFFVWLLGMLFIGSDSITGEVYRNLFRYMVMQIILGIALTTIMVTLNQICRNMGTGIAIGIVMVVFSSFIATGLDTILKFLKLDVKFSDYWIPELIGECPLADIGSSFVIRATISAIVWVILATAGGIIHIKKTDVK